MSYSCSLHGPYHEHSHHCPNCIEEARALLRNFHAETTDRWSRDVREVAELCYTRINGGIDMDGKLVFVNPIQLADVRLTIDVEGQQIIVQYARDWGPFVFDEHLFSWGQGLLKVDRRTLGRVEIEALP